MAYITDSTQSFTISFIALEGFGSLAELYVFDLTDDPSMYSGWFWDSGSGLWNPSQPVITNGHSVHVEGSVFNNGAGSDTIFGEFTSPQVTPSENGLQEAMVLVGDYMSPIWTFTMPAQNVTITINAGHVE